jgi:hypothetical protein
MKEFFVGLVAEKILDKDPAKLADLQSQLSKSCEGKEFVQIPAEPEAIEAKCSDIVSSKPENLGNVIAAAMFEKVYYKKYSCDFIRCIMLGGDNLMVFSSSTGNKFFQDSIIYLAITTMGGVILVLVLNESLASRIKTLGRDCMGVGAIAFLMLLTGTFIPNFVPPEVLPQISGFLSAFEKNIETRFFIIFAMGLIIFIIGFLIGRNKTQPKTQPM